MTRFISTHQAPALDPSEVAAYVPDIKLNTHAQFEQCFINLDGGFIVTVYEAENEDALRQEFDRIGWPVETINEVQYAVNSEGLDAIPAA